MLQDFLAAIITLIILSVVFLYAWIGDVRRIESLNVEPSEQATVGSMVPMEGLEE